METKLIAVINDESEVVIREGKADEGAGIFDLFGNSYNAGISEDLTVYGCAVDSDNSIFVTDGTKMQGFLCGEKCVAVVVYSYPENDLTEIAETNIEGVFDNFKDVADYVNKPNYTIKIVPLNRLNSAGW